MFDEDGNKLDGDNVESNELPDHEQDYDPDYEQPVKESPAPAAKSAKKEKKPIKKGVKIALGAVAAILFAGGFIFIDQMNQRNAPMASDANSALNDESMSMQPVTEPSVVQEQPASAIADTPSSDVIAASSVIDAQSSVVAATVTPVQPVVTQDDPRFGVVNSRLDRIESYLSTLSVQPQSANKASEVKAKHAVTPKVKSHRPASVTGSEHSRKVAAVKCTQSSMDAPKPNIVNGVLRDEVKYGVPGMPVALSNYDAVVSATLPVVEKQVKITKAVKEVKLVSCEYRGGLNNRAWVVCDSDLHSVKAGDALPHPYGTVVSVNDQAGTVSTTGGLIK